MVLEESTIQEIKSKSGLEFNKVKDFVALSDLIMKTTGRSIGTTTLKRLMGNITQYLGFTSWNAYSDQVSNDSLWNYPDDAVYILSLKAGQTLELQYLNRKLKFIVVTYEGQKALKVVYSKNSSLRDGDILLVHHIRKGEVLEAEQVIRGSQMGNYKTHGVVTSIQVK